MSMTFSRTITRIKTQITDFRAQEPKWEWILFAEWKWQWWKHIVELETASCHSFCSPLLNIRQL